MVAWGTKRPREKILARATAIRERRLNPPLSSTEKAVLAERVHCPGCTTPDISTATNRRPNTVSLCLRRLKNYGYLSEDGRPTHAAFEMIKHSPLATTQ